MGLPHVRRGAGKDAAAGREIESGGQRAEGADAGVNVRTTSFCGFQKDKVLLGKQDIHLKGFF